MTYIKAFFLLLLFYSFSYNLHAQDSLTIKQQLDRITEEIKDLNKAVFNKSFNKNELNVNKQQNDNDAERFTSIDIRIYDLEKDIKSLTLQFEEILFKLEDLTNTVYSLESELISQLEKINTKDQVIKKNTEENQTLKPQDENILGELVISDSSKAIEKIEPEKISKKSLENEKEQKLNNLSPEEQLQFALDQMIKKNYNESKKILENFVINFQENQLSGSAHFWLGKIYLFESNYRQAAIVFGEGVQKFPKSIKAAEMYYELAKSLKELDKIPEACKTLSLLEENYKGNKFTKDPEKIKNNLNCEINN